MQNSVIDNLLSVRPGIYKLADDIVVLNYTQLYKDKCKETQLYGEYVNGTMDAAKEFMKIHPATVKAWSSTGLQTFLLSKYPEVVPENSAIDGEFTEGKCFILFPRTERLLIIS